MIPQIWTLWISFFSFFENIVEKKNLFFNENNEILIKFDDDEIIKQIYNDNKFLFNLFAAIFHIYSALIDISNRKFAEL